MASEQASRYTIGEGELGFLVVDHYTGWVKGWFDTKSEAQAAWLRLELGMDGPPCEFPTN